jgi:hypothetical protein
VAYTAWAMRTDQPALDLSLARYGPSALALALCALASVVTWAAVFLLPVFVQSVQGHSALATGLAVLTQPLPPGQLGDANTLINVWQRIAGSFGIGLIAALFTQQTRAHGPVPALHTTGLLIAALSAAGLLAALPLPAVRNTALTGARAGTGEPGQIEEYKS